ncbi:MAG TPA: hypothetical protein VGP36_10825 [Mycobacteriales bacterium]|jgi:hypothetical protein|nr:hypothetical protein [Mycobacteriales bacterium]
MRLAVRREIDKQVTCPACGDILAAAAYRPLSGSLELTAPDGRRLQPTAGAVLLKQLEQWDSMRDRIEFVQRNLEELIFDLRCRRGHSTLAPMPRLARAIRSTPGRWVPAAGT